MGDEITQFTIQVKGTAYRFKPLPPESLAMVLTVVNMGASQSKSLKALGKILADSAGPEQWDEFTDRVIDGEIKPDELSNLFSEIVKRQTADPKKAARKRALAAGAE